MYMNRREKKRKSKIKSKKRFRKYVLLSLIFVAFILLIGFSYEKIGEYNDSKNYSQIGEMVDVNNHKINVFSKGEGNITVVFTGGLNEPSSYVDFYPLYNEISKYTKIAIYDRPGHGWSQVTDVPRDIDSIVEEMHTALVKSGQKPPYILVGHSLASLSVIRFAQTYKDEVSGIVEIDGGSPEFYLKNSLETSSSTAFNYNILKSLGIARFALYHTSYSTKIASGQNNLKLLPNDLKQLYFAMTLKTMYNRNIIDEGNMASANAKTILGNGKLGDIPLRILTSESNTLSIPEWENSQIALKDWSTDSTQMVVKDSRHSIHQFVPDVINNEIIKLIKNQK
ncbi:alpha/beta fold hydrolase [Clostridium frigidicarnis]|uniref:Pimeloyl-ACP methyl ester carboxylesterase n=1 Tax=Clostridium frigidicarnis TaxID=84698 RepID=A0A1I0XTS8_9CLOT|nr:alpha/beta hydrolase [Clostridium frigidicarnis]SFB03588.1 Pimeloyl-ACP methyl ester carboxylesterase [Clostridium frigidicarnis]